MFEIIAGAGNICGRLSALGILAFVLLSENDGVRGIHRRLAVRYHGLKSNCSWNETLNQTESMTARGSTRVLSSLHVVAL
jgi:hypothetical protein